MRTSDAEAPLARIHGFAPVENPMARTLILGSMPGETSLRAGQYYAHPQNLFWKILGEILAGAPDSAARAADARHVTASAPATIAPNLRDAHYAEKLRVLRSADIALWDVLASCHRKGSLDSDIDHATLQANDFAGFFANHPRIQRVLFNGMKAENCFRRYVAPLSGSRALLYMRLPSTSPANASIPYASKVIAWRAALIA